MIPQIKYTIGDIELGEMMVPVAAEVKSLGLSTTYFKGGPGSGSWDGPGDPRFAHEGELTQPSIEETILKYQNGAYQSINGSLRGETIKDEIKPIIDAHIKSLDEAMAPSTSDKYLFRGDGAGISAILFDSISNLPNSASVDDVFFGKIEGKSYNEFFTEKLKGMEFTDKAFLSASTSQRVALDKFVPGTSSFSKFGASGLVEIKVPKGTKMLDVEKVSTMGAEEKEIILARGSRLRIDKVSFEPLQERDSSTSRFYIRWQTTLVTGGTEQKSVKPRKISSKKTDRFVWNPGDIVVHDLTKSLGLSAMIKHLEGTDHDHDQSSHGGKGGARNKTDDEIRQNIQDQRLLSSIYKSDYYGDDDSKKGYIINFEEMTVSDRLKFAEMNAQRSPTGQKHDPGEVPPEFAFTGYNFSIRDKVPKGLSADQLRAYLKEHNFTRDPEGVPYTYYPKINISGNDLIRGLSDAEKDEFVEEFPKSSKRAIDAGKYQVEINPDRDTGLSISQWEKLSDNFETVSGYNGLKLKDGQVDYSNGMDVQKIHLGEFSKDREVALTSLLSGWAITGGGISEQKIIREVSAGLFPANKGVLFYDSTEPGIDPGKKLYSKTRMAEHFAALKTETEDFYKKKFAKKSDPNPDLSMKTVEVWRGVGGHFDDYIPSAAESWSAQKSSANKFGKMTSQGGRDWGTRSAGKYTLVAAKVSYNDVLWSYESVKGKYGWPDDKELKGKKEHVIIGGALKSGNTTVENLYD